MSTEIKGFYISTSGDTSVGIFPANWSLHGEFYFDEPSDLEEFRKALSQLFADYITGEMTGVQTFEERGEQLKKEDEFLSQQTK